MSIKCPFKRSTEEINTETITDNENRPNILGRNINKEIEATDVANSKIATKEFDRCGKPEGNDKDEIE